MCGLTAVYGQKLSLIDIDILRTLLHLSDLRGGYGAGEVSVTKKESYHVIKDNFSAYDLINTKAFNDRMKDDITLVIGHSRWPTKGSQTKANAHPHICGNIIGTHNGTFKSVFEEEILPTENDSKKFFEAVSKYGIEETVSKTTGAYALIWIDKEVREFRILRNHERPLFIACVKSYPNAKSGDYKTIFVSSEKRMLVFALDRHGRLDDAEITEVPTNKMLCFPHTPENYILPEPNIVEIPECKRYFFPKAYWNEKNRSHFENSHPKSNLPSNVTNFQKSRVVFKGGQFYDVLPSGAEVVWSKQRTVDYIKNTSYQEDKKNEIVPFCTESLLPLEKEILRIQKASGSKIGSEDKLNLPTDFTDPTVLMYETKKNFFVSLGKYEELLQSGCVWCADVPEAIKDSKTKPHFFSATEFMCHECMKNEDAILLANIPMSEKRA